MCKKAPGRRCSGHLTENITNLQSKIKELAPAHAANVAVLQAHRAADPNFDETERGQEMKEQLAKTKEQLDGWKESLDTSEAAYHLTEKGKEHLQSIIDDPDATPAAKFRAAAQLAAAKAQDPADQKVIGITRDPDLNVLDKADLLNAHRREAAAQLEEGKTRLEQVNKMYAYHKSMAETMREAGMSDEAAAHAKEARKCREEATMLSSHNRQIQNHIDGIDRYLNRKEREEQVRERQAAAEERRADIERARRRKDRKRRRAQFLDRLFDKAVKIIIKDFL